MKNNLLFEKANVFLLRSLAFLVMFVFTVKSWAQATLPVSAPFTTVTTAGAGTMPTGFTHSGLTGYAGSLKFDTQDDYLQLNFTGVPGTLTFDVGVNNTYPGTIPAGVTFTVQQSVDGTTWTSLATYSNVAGGTKTISSIGTSIRYFRWYYTIKPSGTNLSMRNISLTAGAVLSNPTFNAFSNVNKVYGDSGFTMSASSDSAGAITYTSTATSVATINSSTGAVVIKGAGTTTIIANQASAGLFNSGSTSATLTISPATSGLTITANGVSKTYGTSLTNGSSTGFSVSGLLYTDTLGTGATVTNTYGTGAASTDSATLSTVSPAVYTGSVTPSALINGTGATYNAANYAAVTYVSGAITVSKANQSIVFASTDSKVYGTADYSPAATSVTSGVNAITYSTNGSTVATIESGNIHIVGIGSAVITAAQAGDDNYNTTSATQTLTVTAKNLTVTGLTANNKNFDGTTDATLSGSATLVGVVGSDDVSLSGTAVATFASSSVGTGIQVNVSGYSLNGTTAGNYTFTQPILTADIIANTPTLFTSGSLAAVNTTYGTASATPSSFNVSAQSLTDSILVSAPAGFEVSLSSASGYNSSVSFGAAGSVSSTPIYVRLAAANAAGTYSGDVTVSSNGASSLTVATASSTVAPKGLTISGLTGVNKTYDASTAATVIGTATLNGIVGADDVTLNSTSVTYNFGTATAGASKPVTVLGFTLNGTASANYTVAQPTGITATINKAASTISVTGAFTFTYNGTAQGPNTSSVTGSTGAVSYNYTGVSPVVAASSTRPTNVGSYTVNATVTTDSNYEAATSTDFSFAIGKADQTITLAETDAKTTATTTYTLTANASSGLAITYSSSNSAVATISGNTVTIVGAGLTTITASQAGNDNYNAAITATQSLTVIQAPIVLAGWDFTGIGTVTNTTIAATTFNSSLVSISGANNITRGSSAAWSTAANSFRTTGFQSNGIATSNTDYFQTTIKPATGKLISLTSINANLAGTTGFAVSPGVSSQFAYSTNGTTFTLIGSPTVTVGTPATLSIDLTAVSALQNIPAGTTVTFRYYASGQTTTGGWGFQSAASAGTNGLSFSGLVNQVPAPSITSVLSSTAIVGTAYSYSITADNSPTSFNATGLPTGLSINSTSGLISGTPTVAGTYTVSISATNITGTDTKSLELTIGKGNQTITFGTLANKTYGDASFTLNGTATSGLTVTYSSSNTSVATISGATVTVVGAGSTTITASQVGDDNYNTASTVDQVLVINKANQTISFSALSPKNDVDGSFTLGATASSGLDISYTSSNTAVVTISGNTVTIVAPGTSTITASQAGNDNYNAAISVDQEQTIINTQLANQIITFNALPSVTYGDAPFTLNGTVDSALTLTYESSNPAVASISGNVVTIHTPGTVVITASQDGDSGHNPAVSVTQTLVVAKKGLNAVNVSVASKSYDGTTSATLNAELSGVVGSDDVVLNHAAVFATANVGTGIAVTANLSLSGLESSRYEVAQPTGLSADITLADQIISFGALTDKTYGDAAFTLSAIGGASGEPIVFTSSDPLIATVTGNTVTIVGVGLVTITASQAGNSNYNAATDVAQSFTVNKANQAITFNTLVNRTTAETTYTLNAFATSFLTVTYASSNTAVATVSGNIVTIVGPGSTTITASQVGNEFYNAATEVSQSQLVLTAIAKWTFDAVTLTSPGSSAVISAGSAVADQGLQTSGSLFSATHTGAATIWTTPAGNGSTKSVTSDRWAVGDFYQFKVNTSNYHDLAIAFDQTGSNTGPSTFKVQYSLNGITYSDLGSTYVVTNDGWSGTSYKSISNKSFDLSALSSLNNKAEVYFRIVDTNTTAINGTTVATGGTNRIDNFVITGIACEGATATISADAATSFCEGGSVVLTASEGPSYLWSTGATTQSITVSATGNYSVQEISTNGCSATSNTISVTATPYTSNTTTVSVCDSYVWSVNGQTYTATGNYTVVNGCQTENLNLTITPSTSHTTTISACDGYTWSVNDQEYTASGTYTVTDGCHSEILVLTINSNSVHTTTVSSCGSYTWNNTTYTSSGTYTGSTTNCVTEVLNLTITPCNSIVNVKLHLQGYYDASAHAMRPVMANQGVGSSSTDVDTVTVELHDATTFATVATATATLHTDGTATATYGTAPTGSFFIVIKHRNSVQTWSSTPQTVGSTALTYDFTTAANKAYGDNMVEVETGVYAMYTGDIDQDGNVNNVDYSLWETDANNLEFGYFATDLDGDGNVNNVDYSIWESTANALIYSVVPNP